MMKFHLKTSVLLLSLGFMLGFFASVLLFSTEKIPISKHEKSNTLKEVKKEVALVEKSYQSAINDLQNQNILLQKSMEVNQNLLTQAKMISKQKAKGIRKIIEQKDYLAKELLFSDESVPLITSPSPCDTLIKEVSAYIGENNRKDSIYEVQLMQVDSLVSVKESLIEIRTNENNELKILLSQSLDHQKGLTKENKVLRKQFKRQKFKSKLLMLGTFIISAVGANYIIHH